MAHLFEGPVYVGGGCRQAELGQELHGPVVDPSRFRVALARRVLQHQTVAAHTLTPKHPRTQASTHARTHARKNARTYARARAHTHTHTGQMSRSRRTTAHDAGQTQGDTDESGAHETGVQSGHGARARSTARLSWSRHPFSQLFSGRLSGVVDAHWITRRSCASDCSSGAPPSERGATRTSSLLSSCETSETKSTSPLLSPSSSSSTLIR